MRIICVWRPRVVRPSIVRRIIENPPPRPRVRHTALALVCFAVPGGIGAFALLPGYAPPALDHAARAPFIEPVPISEPSALLLFAFAAVMLAVIKRRR